MASGVTWITKGGVHIPITESGSGKSTNDYMNKKIRGKDTDLSYQGSSSDVARSTGKNASEIYEIIQGWQKENKNAVLLKNSKEAISQLKKAQNNPNAKITIYRATPGKSINKGDWIFLDKEKADSWSKDLFFGKTKPGYKVIKMEVKAKDIDWTGKNLEFMYKGD